MVYLLGGTSSSITTAVGSTWCNDPRSGYDCNQRGRGFDTSASKTWHEIGQWTLGIRDGVLIEPYLQWTTKDLGYGEFGRDSIKILLDQSDKRNITLATQTIATVNDTTQLLGTFGLGLNTRSFSNDERYPSFMSTLFDSGMIPSRSYGYTAGNYFKTMRTPMDLVLGGTNLGRYSRNNVTFPLDANRNPVVNLDSIQVSATGTPPWGAGAYTLMVEPAQVMIDSETPFLWLPVSACRMFEQALGLVWNSTMNLYLTNNDTLYKSLTGPNLTFTFTLNGQPGSPQSVDIAIPFTSLDLTISWPYLNISSTETIRYFPLKRASNEQQYTLGRAFLQEAYLAVDYDRGNFSVHTPYFPPRNDNIEAIINPADVVTPSKPKGSSSGLSTGAVIGIAIGIGFAVVAFIAAVIYFYRRRKAIRDRKTHSGIYNSDPGIPEAYGTSIAAKPPFYTSPIVEAPSEGAFIPRSELTAVNLDPAELDDTGRVRERFSWEDTAPADPGRNIQAPLLGQGEGVIELSPVSQNPAISPLLRQQTTERPRSEASPVSPASRGSPRD